MRDWVKGSDEWQSAGILTDGSQYGVPEGLIFSFPCRITGPWQYEIVQGLEISEANKARFAATIQELEEERAAIAELL